MMRADLFLFRAGYAKSRQKAQELIRGGAVTIDGKVCAKPADLLDETVLHKVVLQETNSFVSRGGLKLDAAMNAFPIPVNGAIAADIGASTGGFTECLLRRGAKKVYAIDAGYRQLAPVLSADPRVISIEHFNARNLSFSAIGEFCDLAVMDVSFISQTYIIPGIASVLRAGGHFVSLIKPQFEAGREAVGKGGIVHSGAYRFLAVKRVLHAAELSGFSCLGLIRSPIKGGDGNIEYLAAFVKADLLLPPIPDAKIRKITEPGADF